MPEVDAVPELVPARMLNELLYCERLMYLEWAQGEFSDNQYTVDGRVVHRRADQPGGRLPKPPEKPKRAKELPDDGVPDDEPLPYQARSVWLSSQKLGMTAKIDIVEGNEAGTVFPIEYKRGKPPDVPEGAHLPERAQLCAQVLLLREHGYRCNEAALYFAAARRRVSIGIDEVLIATTLTAVARARELAIRAELPPPLIDSPKCNGCSLVSICLPDETNLLRRTGIPTEELPDHHEESSALRRLHPARDDKLPLYVQEQGARIGLSGECLNVRSRDGASAEVRLAHTSQVALLGNVQITTQALRALLEREIPLSFFSTGGWFYGRAVGHGSKNVELRMAQLRAAIDPERTLVLARRFVTAKIRNCRTLLRRNHGAIAVNRLGELEQYARRAERAADTGELLGLEGNAARIYFGEFAGMLKTSKLEGTGFDFEGRNRRPPRDPVNAMLSLAYSMLAREFAITLGTVGFDPMIGFYHQPRFGRPSLALDLMEEFRPIIADSVVIGSLNNGLFGREDFHESPVGVALTPFARRRFIEAYERRMDQLITHPIFGYRLSYRRVIEVQCRLLARYLLGEIESYPEFRTR